MTRLAIIADTHIPSRADALPAAVVDELHRADIVVHAGDFDSVDAYETIDGHSSRLVAVRGNTDPDLGLPETTSIEVAGQPLVVTHGSGPLRGYRDRVIDTVRSVATEGIAIAGHTHQLTDVTVGGTRLLNPGSATGARPADRATMLRGDFEGDRRSITSLVVG